MDLNPLKGYSVCWSITAQGMYEHGDIQTPQFVVVLNLEGHKYTQLGIYIPQTPPGTVLTHCQIQQY